MSIEQYVESRIAAALEVLESGVQMGNQKEVRMAIATFQSLDGIVTLDKDEDSVYATKIREGMVRGCSAMCIMDRAKAIQYLDLGSKYDQNSPVILNNYGFCYAQQRMWEKAIASYTSCIKADPSYAMAYLGLGGVYASIKESQKHLDLLEEATLRCEGSPEVWNAFGLAHVHHRRFDDSAKILGYFRKALDLDPSPGTKATLLTNVGHLHGALGDYPLAVSHYLDAIQADKSHAIAYQNILMNLHYFSDTDISRSAIIRRMLLAFDVSPGSLHSIIRKMHDSVCQILFRTSYDSIRVAMKPKNGPLVERASGRLRVGYMMPDLFDPSTGGFTKHLWKDHNPHGFEVFLYCNSRYDGPVVKTIAPASYKCIDGLHAQSVADMIKNDAVDVLIELGGHGSGNRLDVLALRPAPVLLSYLVYPALTGVAHVRRLTGTHEKGTNREEDCVFLKGLPVAYSGPTWTSPAVLSQHLKSYQRFKPSASAVTYGCFASLQKINNHVIAAWKVILIRVPRGRLLLKSDLFQDPAVQALWRKKFGEVGDRVVLLTEPDSPDQRLRLFSKIDIYLDSFPYTDTCSLAESIYMNVPVISFCPRNRNSASTSQLLSASMLTSLGLTNHCLSDNLSMYVQKATDLIQELPHLSVRKAYISTQLSNIKGFMKDYEATLIDLYIDED